MNQVWKQFLISQNAHIEDAANITFPKVDLPQAGAKRIYALAHLSILKISGKDAAAFLQGQITCNVKDITEHQGSIGAYCNAKGRVIATFVLIKSGHDFLMVLPQELSAKVCEQLQKYILRAAVVLSSAQETLCLFGWSEASKMSNFSVAKLTESACAITLPGQRILLIAEPQAAETIWSAKIRLENFLPADSCEWRYLDILAGLPWLTAATSEEFIPQMLNIDKLGGISFTKGCYTGQEIVARTHYLGKNKREMVLAESETAIVPAPNTPIVQDQDLTVGHVVQSERREGLCKMLIVLQTGEFFAGSLHLQNTEGAKIKLLTL
jgi:folate-binding protein YgfZ